MKDVRQPPVDEEAETAVLGACLNDPGVVPAAVELLDSGSFHSAKNGAMFAAIAGLFHESKPVDVITVREELRRIGKLQLVGGIQGLNETVSAVVSSANIEAHAQIVAEKSLLRKAITVIEGQLDKLYGGDADALNIVRDSVEQLYAVAYRKWQQRSFNAETALDALFQSLGSKEREDMVSIGRETPFAEYNGFVGGLIPGRSTIVTGFKSTGKSALAVKLALHEAQYGHVLYRSLEMPAEELVARMVCQGTRVQPKTVLRADLSEIEYAEFKEATERFRKLNIEINDNPSCTLSQLKAEAKKSKMSNNLSMLVVDYLNLMENRDRDGNREQEIASISRGLKVLARELGIPVIAIAALDKMGRIRESSMVEYDADVMVRMERPETEDKSPKKDEWHSDKTPKFEDGTDARGLVQLRITKARSGVLGAFKLRFTPSADLIAVNDHPTAPVVEEESDGLPF
jgi:replicative DNA helicase